MATEELKDVLNDLTEKNEPIADDTLGLNDSEDSSNLKKATLSAIKRAVLGYREFAVVFQFEGPGNDPFVVEFLLNEFDVTVEVNFTFGSETSEGVYTFPITNDDISTDNIIIGKEIIRSVEFPDDKLFLEWEIAPDSDAARVRITDVDDTLVSPNVTDAIIYFRIYD